MRFGHGKTAGLRKIDDLLIVIFGRAELRGESSGVR